MICQIKDNQIKDAYFSKKKKWESSNRKLQKSQNVIVFQNKNTVVYARSVRDLDMYVLILGPFLAREAGVKIIMKWRSKSTKIKQLDTGFNSLIKCLVIKNFAYKKTFVYLPSLRLKQSAARFHFHFSIEVSCN